MALRKLSSLLCGLEFFILTARAGSIPLDISANFNNKAFGSYPGEASFDGLGQAYPAPPAAYTPSYTSRKSGIVYDFPGYTGSKAPDNIVCAGQRINIPQNVSQVFSVSFLVSGDVEFATATGNVTFHYADGASSNYELRALDWFSWLTLNRGELVFPFRFTQTGVNWNTSHVFERTAPLDPERRLTGVTLPDSSRAGAARLHVFSVSLWGADEGRHVEVQAVRPTQKWFDPGEQVVEVVVNNVGREECVAGSGITVGIAGDGFETTRMGKLKRLCPGDQKVVRVGVRGSSDGAVDVQVVVGDDVGRRVVSFSSVEIGLTDWTPDLDNLARHEAPDWFNAAKFGIFIQ
ncbi:hypothetical protein F4803DRAFT_194638 [Xylaria telfairii]|nr:hypothetical protein F4803DRAFT_194638 [Xylaria telfairii]